MTQKRESRNDYTIDRNLNSKLPTKVEELEKIVEEIISIGEKEGVMPIGALNDIKIAGETLTYFFTKYNKIASRR